MRTARIAASMAALGGLMLAAIVLAPASARDRHLQASLVDPAGNRVGTVTFTITPTATLVNARFAPTPYVAPAAFHGFHIHANRDHTNGDGCIADPAAASGTWFVTVDGHLSQPVKRTAITPVTVSPAGSSRTEQRAKDSAMAATHPHPSHFAPAPVHLSWLGAGRHPRVRAATSALCVAVLVIALAVVALGILTVGDPDGGSPSPIPRNNEPSPSNRAP